MVAPSFVWCSDFRAFQLSVSVRSPLVVPFCDVTLVSNWMRVRGVHRHDELPSWYDRPLNFDVEVRCGEWGELLHTPVMTLSFWLDYW